jgi:monolysocardiolipin acyltransferase
VTITFSENLDGELAFEDLGGKCRKMQARAERLEGRLVTGVLNDTLKYSDDAGVLQKEWTVRAFEAVLEARGMRSFPDEDPKEGLVEIIRDRKRKGQRRREDGSYTRDT